MIVFGQKWFYSAKNGRIRANWLYSGTVDVFVQSGCIRTKGVVEFGQNGCVRGKCLYSGNVVEFGRMGIFSGNVVVFGQGG